MGKDREKREKGGPVEKKEEALASLLSEVIGDIGIAIIGCCLCHREAGLQNT
jgi:hypothetical protein